MTRMVVGLLLCVACDGGAALDAGPGFDAGPFDAGPPPAAGPRFVGRHVMEADGSVRFSWSGSGFIVRFRGTGARATLNDAAQFYTVVVDGEVQPRLAVSGGEQTYDLATGLADGEHTVEVYRRTEASFGASVVRDITVDGEMLAVPEPERSIEVIGDSISTAFGVEGPDENCGFSADTENVYLSYASIAARMFGAELSTVAWSGKGVVYNYDVDTWEPMPTLYDRVIADEEGATDGVIRRVDLVIINLGSNDFSTDGDPTEDVFTPAYVGLLEAARARHPDATILCTVGPLLEPADMTTARQYIMSAIAMRNAAGDANVRSFDIGDLTIIDDWGCVSHPGDRSQEALAANLIAAVQAELGW